MEDKELLELAAKAANLPVVFDGHKPMLKIGGGDIGVWRSWNPLTDDCDALRLAVKLEMDFCRFGDMSRALVESIRPNHFIAIDEMDYRDNEYDPYAATRRAIVRAAAEIGKAMP